MDFELSEQHKMLKQTVLDFTAKEITPIAHDLDKSGEFPRDSVDKMADLGLFGLLTPPAYDGSGFDRIGSIIAVEELAVASAGVAAPLASNYTVTAAIQAMGNEEQKSKYLPNLANGKQLGAIATTEPGGGANSTFTMQSTARLENDFYVLNGTKCFISSGGEAEINIVLARTDSEKNPMGISGLIVEKGTPGFSFGKKDDKLGLRNNITRELIFEDCRVPKANLLADSILGPMATPLAMIGMPLFGAMAVGVARAALEAATEYVKQRTVAFGQTLANFDGVQCMIADMVTMVEASRLLVYQAGSTPDNKPDIPRGFMASIFPCEAAQKVTTQALQIFGGYGYTTDFPLERYFRDARGLMLIGQSMDVRKLIMARLKLGLPPSVPPGGMSTKLP